MVRIIRIGGWTMIWSGLLVLSYVGYQVFGTDLATARQQEAARSELTETLADRRAALEIPVPETTLPVADTVPGDGEGDGRPPAPPEDEPPELVAEDAPATGEILGSIRIPSIDVDQVVLEGVDPETLEAGPGHIPGTAFPGQPGNAAISGHRTTYGRPFFDLDLLESGDIIEVETAIGAHIYAVRETEIVAPTDVWVIGDRPGAWLTLTTCHPKWSARERLIVFAELVDGPNLEHVEAAA
jgi:sortase A